MIGIYKITNKVNNWSYIGSSKSIENRWKQHLKELEDEKHHCHRLQYDFNKYGVCEFDFSILELCDEEMLLSREQHYINKNYNEGMIYNTRINVYSDDTNKIYLRKKEYSIDILNNTIFPSKNIKVFDNLSLQRIFFIIMHEAISTNSRYIEISVKDYTKMIGLNGNTYYDKFEEVKVELENFKIDDKKVFENCEFDRSVLVVVINDFIFENISKENISKININITDILKLRSPKTLALLFKIGDVNELKIGFEEIKELVGVSDKYCIYSKFKSGVLKYIEKDLSKIGRKLTFNELRKGRDIEVINIKLK